jgi:hypothetical protein
MAAIWLFIAWAVIGPFLGYALGWEVGKVNGRNSQVGVRGDSTSDQ